MAGKASTSPTPRSTPSGPRSARLSRADRAASSDSQVPPYPPRSSADRASVAPPARCSTSTSGVPTSTSTTPGGGPRRARWRASSPARRRARGPEPVRAMPGDEGDVGERLGVGQQGGPPRTPALGGPVRRHRGQRRAPGEVVHDRRRLARDVAVGTADDPWTPRSEPRRAPLGQGRGQGLAGRDRTPVDPEHDVAGTDGLRRCLRAVQDELRGPLGQASAFSKAGSLSAPFTTTTGRPVAAATVRILAASGKAAPPRPVSPLPETESMRSATRGSDRAPGGARPGSARGRRGSRQQPHGVSPGADGVPARSAQPGCSGRRRCPATDPARPAGRPPRPGPRSRPPVPGGDREADDGGQGHQPDAAEGEAERRPAGGVRAGPETVQHGERPGGMGDVVHLPPQVGGGSGARRP